MSYCFVSKAALKYVFHFTKTVIKDLLGMRLLYELLSQPVILPPITLHLVEEWSDEPWQ